jgi:DNA repair exonuclease SbcCD ATPase subunit
MNRTLPHALVVSVLGTALLAAACGKGAAEKALSAADAAFEQAKPEIEKYVPEELKALSREVRAARAAFDKGDYEGALASAQALQPQIQAALEAARKKKEELQAAFERLKASLPDLLASLEKRLSALARAATLPAGLDLATVETAQANLATLAANWEKAAKSFEAGDVLAAVGQGNEVKTALDEMSRLFLPSRRTARAAP